MKMSRSTGTRPGHVKLQSICLDAMK